MKKSSKKQQSLREQLLAETLTQDNGICNTNNFRKDSCWLCRQCL